MMASTKKIEFEAHVRHAIGKGASRRLRREEKVPAVMYGGGKDPVSLTLEHKKLLKALENDAFYSSILTLKIDSEAERVILKDVQRHPFKPRIMHLDFQRVRADEKLSMSIPLHFIGEEKTPGIQIGGGTVSYLETDVEISCLPDDLPEFIEVDISEMQINQILHLSDLKMPKEVEIVALAHGDDKPIVSVHIPRVEEEVIPEGAPTQPTEVPAISQKGEEEKK